MVGTRTWHVFTCQSRSLLPDNVYIAFSAVLSFSLTRTGNASELSHETKQKQISCFSIVSTTWLSPILQIILARLPLLHLRAVMYLKVTYTLFSDRDACGIFTEQKLHHFPSALYIPCRCCDHAFYASVRYVQ